MNFIIAAGGTGGHIFPALSTALELRKACRECSLVWIGTARNRERELCEKFTIPIEIIAVSGINRGSIVSLINSSILFVRAFVQMMLFFQKQKADAVLAFGGYVCAPVLTAAKFHRIPYFLQEQNSVPGFVNRWFSRGAECTFLGYPITGPWKLNGKTVVTGTPVRTMTLSVTQFTYPEGYDPNATTIVICGGSQGAASMNESLIGPVKKMADNGLQIVWQTGTPSFDKITCQMSGYQRLFIFAVIHDLYPYYEHAKVLICRAGASTLSEAAYFGLPCIMIPLPWAADNHQWKNAGIVEQQGWGIRVDQNEQCGTKVEQAVFQIVTNTLQYTKMRQKALLNSPAHSAAKIVEIVISQLKKA